MNLVKRQATQAAQAAAAAAARANPQAAANTDGMCMIVKCTFWERITK